MKRLSLTFLALQLIALSALGGEKTNVTRSMSLDGTYTMSLAYPSGKTVEGLVDMDAYKSQFEILSDLSERVDAHPSVHILLGEIYASGYGCKQDKDKAMELIRRGLLSDDKYVRLNARLTRAWIFHRWKKYSDAYQELEQLDRITPFWDNSALYYSLSWLGRDNGLSKSELHICNEKAAQWGHTKGMLACSSDLLSGEGVPKDYRASYAYALLTKGLGEDKDFWKGDLKSLDEITKILERLLPPAEMIKGQQEATELRKLVVERKVKQREEIEKLYLVQKSFDEWCIQKIGADFYSAWSVKWKEKIKGVEYVEPLEKK
jgi:hypothetical protein